ncbi:molybdopterin molybdotransferase [Sphingomonas jejuensis]|uniref:Molybdopterin molybdenumtransferase n=1 Tax=Sphingomonas jejuensis TaxID=904715 RepID=A0ABX0XM15_9SPHN|nr:gephyrin-like molybdotransferase Glp [Sphingomonas jejuensis]NJC33797.1 molybdopterin molybdotransferase [Sphingomonas jejuensis]
MLPLAEAQARVAALARRRAGQIDTVPLVDALGRRLATPLHARRTQPARHLSAMDGYALAAADAGQVLRLVGESAAGRAHLAPIGTGETVRIFTGAALPPGADCVLIQENVARDGDRITQVAGDTPRPGRHVRPEGSDFREGDRLADAATLVTPRLIALLAAAGHAELPVLPRPRVALLSTGDELVAPGAPTTPDQLPSSNAPMLAAMLSAAGADILDLGIVPDDPDAITAAIAAGTAAADILVTTGGASVGDHDLVRPAMVAAGARIDFWRVAMRPGKPLIVGERGGCVILGLPGNPVSAYVTARLFVLPLVAMLGGADAADAFPQTRALPLGTALGANDGRTDHLRARLVDGAVLPVGPNDSAALKGLAAADALIVRAPHAPALVAGDLVDVILPA